MIDPNSKHRTRSRLTVTADSIFDWVQYRCTQPDARFNLNVNLRTTSANRPIEAVRPMANQSELPPALTVCSHRSLINSLILFFFGGRPRGHWATRIHSTGPTIAVALSLFSHIVREPLIKLINQINRFPRNSIVEFSQTVLGLCL